MCVCFNNHVMFHFECSSIKYIDARKIVQPVDRLLTEKLTYTTYIVCSKSLLQEETKNNLSTAMKGVSL